MLRLLSVVALAAAASVRAAPAGQAGAALASASPFNNTGADVTWQALERKLVELLFKLQRQQQQQQQRRADGVDAASLSASQLRASTELVEPDFGEGQEEADESRVDIEEAAESDRILQLPPADSLPSREVEKHSASANRCHSTLKTCRSNYIMGTRQYQGDVDRDEGGGGGEGVRQGSKRVPEVDSSFVENPANAVADAADAVAYLLAAEDLAAPPPVARRFPWSLSRKSLRLELLKRKLADLYDLVDDLERDDYDDETAAAAAAARLG